MAEEGTTTENTTGGETPAEGKTQQTDSSMSYTPSPEEGKNQSEEQLLAGKYKNEEELEKGILELAKKKNGSLEEFYKQLESGGVKEENSSNTSEENQKEGESSEDLTMDKEKQKSNEDLSMDKKDEEKQTDSEKEEQQKKTTDLSEYEKEFFAKGEVSPEAKQKLIDEGVFPDERTLDTYFKGLEAQAADFKKTLFDAAGSEENYHELIKWGKENLSESEIDFFNKALMSGDPAQAGLAVEGVLNKYNKTNNSLNLISGEDSSYTSRTPGYRNRMEMVQDMSDPRYESDPSFREAVEEKIKKTTAF